LRFHRVGEPVPRGFILDGKQPHTTPVIVEIGSDTQWSVDSWTKTHGQSPDIMTISEWKTRDQSHSNATHVALAIPSRNHQCREATR
jgi:hypothetical protein